MGEGLLETEGLQGVLQVEGEEGGPEGCPEQAEEEAERVVAQPPLPVVEEQPKLQVGEEKEGGVERRVEHGQPQLYRVGHGGPLSQGRPLSEGRRRRRRRRRRAHGAAGGNGPPTVAARAPAPPLSSALAGHPHTTKWG